HKESAIGVRRCRWRKWWTSWASDISPFQGLRDSMLVLQVIRHGEVECFSCVFQDVSQFFDDHARRTGVFYCAFERMVCNGFPVCVASAFRLLLQGEDRRIRQAV